MPQKSPASVAVATVPIVWLVMLVVSSISGVSQKIPSSTANLAGKPLVYVSGGIVRNNFIAGLVQVLQDL